MTITNSTGLVRLIENSLGCVPPRDPRMPLWKSRSVMAARMNKKIREEPLKYTWRNLELTVAYLARQKRVIPTPMMVFAFVDEAVAFANPVTERSLGALIDSAVEWEHTNHLPGWQDWLDRLTRAFGKAREDVYAEWRKARGHHG